MLIKGNTKLGKEVYGFSLPAVRTCPGRTAACTAACYGRRGYYPTADVRGRLEKNLGASRRADFAEKMAAAVRRREAAVVRVHVVGDFYSAAYAGKWAAVAAACPDTLFYFYTRSWRDARVLPAVAALAGEKNVRAWWSCDRDTGVPAKPPRGVRLAYMLDAEEDADTSELVAACDLVFRTHKLRGKPAASVAGVPVCPTETGSAGSEAATCSACRFCWSDKSKAKTKTKFSQKSSDGRTALPVV